MEGAVKAFSMKESLAGVSGDYKEVANQLAKEARECECVSVLLLLCPQ